jgi:putative SOS response-associated peptidase YedK
MTQYFVADGAPVQWLWVHCRSAFCGHVRAMPLAPWRIRWGVENPSLLMRRFFKCGACGRRGCEFVVPRRGNGRNGARIEDAEEYPHGKEMRMGQGEAAWPETRWEATERVLKDYLKRYPCGDAIRTLDCMCNLYSLRAGQKHIADSARAVRDLTGNMPPYPAIFPNRIAPVVRVAPDGVRELLNMRWGFPPPNIPGSKPRNPYLTNVRNCDSRYWQTYLKKPEHRCLVPFTSFAEPDNNQGSRSIWTWFAGRPPYTADEPRPLLFFAGIWREWEGDRGTKAAPDVGRHVVFNFLTTDASADVMAIHPDATPVILFNEAEREQWMSAPWEIARDLQRPPPAGALRVVATDTKEDAA